MSGVLAASQEALPAVFLPYQQRFWQAIDANDVVVVEKSRRTGFTWAAAAPSVEYAAKSGPGGMDVVYVGYETKMTREFIDYVEMFAREFQAACSAAEDTVWQDPEHPERSVKTQRIAFASGHDVITLPSVARALRGKQALAILDEAAFMDDLKGMIKAALAYLMWGGKVVIISTHDGDMNPFNELVVAIRAGKHPDYKLLRVTFEDAVAEGLYRRICLRKRWTWSPEGELEWRQRIERIYAENLDEELGVIPNPSTGVYLSTVLLEQRATAVEVVLRWTAPADFEALGEDARRRVVDGWIRTELLPRLDRLDPNESHALGQDFGRIRDLTVQWLLAKGRDLVRRTRLVVELRKMPFRQQEQVLFALCDAVPRLRAGKLDAGGNGMYLAEVAVTRYGERFEGVQLSEPWYREHMPRMKAGLDDGTLTLPRDDEVLDDLRMLKLVRGVARVPDRRRDDTGAQRHGDAAIALCLAYAASEADPEEYGYTPARPRELATSGGARGWSEQARDEEEDMRTPTQSLFPTFRGRAFG